MRDPKIDYDMITADYIIDVCNNQYKIGKPHSKYPYVMSTTYLQILLYFMNVAHMVLYGYQHPLIQEKFELGDHGALLYHVYRNYHMDDVENGTIINHTLPALNFKNVLKAPSKRSYGRYPQTYLKGALSEKTRIFIKHILPNFLYFSPATLEHHSLDDAKFQNLIRESNKQGMHRVCDTILYYDNHLTTRFFKQPRHWFWANINSLDTSNVKGLM